MAVEQPQQTAHYKSVLHIQQTPHESKSVWQMACVILVKLIIQPERLSDKQDTQSNNTPANQQVGNDQTP